MSEKFGNGHTLAFIKHYDLKWKQHEDTRAHFSLNIPHTSMVSSGSVLSMAAWAYPIPNGIQRRVNFSRKYKSKKKVWIVVQTSANNLLLFYFSEPPEPICPLMLYWSHLVYNEKATKNSQAHFFTKKKNTLCTGLCTRFMWISIKANQSNTASSYLHCPSALTPSTTMFKDGHLCMCMCIYIYIYIYTYTDIHTYVAYMWIHIHTYMYNVFPRHIFDVLFVLCFLFSF